MSKVPDISVVMSVYNGADDLPASIDSVLSQDGVHFEFIIVDDGSTDRSAEILNRYQAIDKRIRVVRQDNQGLTRALVHGCRLARGQFIARQDCGDLSLTGRLQTGLSALAGPENPALISCATRFVGPAGELLYETAIDQEKATEGLMAQDLQHVRGASSHGSTMFRRDLYERVGGYREEFYFAQDLDLWSRLVEHGKYITLPVVQCQAAIAVNSISGVNRDRQIETARIIVECSQLRRAGLSEADALQRARAIRPKKRAATAAERAAALYFIGSCLYKRADPGAKVYFRRALRVYPLHMKSAFRLLLG